MRRVSNERATRIASCQDFRKQLVRTVGHCELCGHDPKRVRPGGVAWALHVHEICRGCHRSKALDKPFALLVVCFKCHEFRLSSRAEWPESRQLAVLKRRRPEDYDLGLFNKLVGWGPRRVTAEEVAAWAR